MRDETKAPVRSIAEVIEIMQPIFEWATRDALKCAQLRDGLAVATDGRVLVRVEMPGFRPTPEAAAGCVAGVLDFVPEEGRVVAGREWIKCELDPCDEDAALAALRRHPESRMAVVYLARIAASLERIAEQMPAVPRPAREEGADE